jgi:hypothetical protein
MGWFRRNKPVLVMALALLAVSVPHAWLVVDGMWEGRTFYFWKPNGWGPSADIPIERHKSPKSYWATQVFHSSIALGTGAAAGVLIWLVRRE